MCIAMPLDHNFSIIGGVAQSQTKHCSSTAKCVINLKFERGLALWWSLSNIHQTQSSEKKIPIQRVFPNLVTYNYDYVHACITRNNHRSTLELTFIG